MGFDLPILSRQRRRRGSFSSPVGLFALSEPGLWLDPSDLSTMFQDRAGSTPVTAPGQSVGLRLDKSKELVLGPELVTNSTFGSGATGWYSLGSTVPISDAFVVGGALQVSNTTVQNPATTISTLPIGGVVVVTFRARLVSGSVAALVRFSNNFGANIVTAANFGTLTSTWTTYRLTFVNTGVTRAIFSFREDSGIGGVYEVDDVSVRELAGNHAPAIDDAARGIYGIEPFGGRRNLLTFTEQFDNAIWVKAVAGTGVTPVLTSGFADPDGGSTAWRLQLNAGANGASDYSLIRQSSGSWPDDGTRSIWIRSNTGLNQTVTLVATNNSFRVTVTPTWQRFVQATGTGAKQLDVSVGGAGSTGATADVLIWHPQFEASATATAYQRVTDQYDVTEAGQPTLHYVQYNDDGYVTPTVTPGTDKVQVFAGVRKLGEGTGWAVIGSAASGPSSTAGSIELGNYSVTGVVANFYGWWSRGSTVLGLVAASGYTSPITNVLTGIGDISGDRSTLRVNGAQVAQSTDDQGTGNFGSYPLYIGRRGGTTLPFDGRDYGIIVRFGANLDADIISATERWMATKTGVTL